MNKIRRHFRVRHWMQSRYWILVLALTVSLACNLTIDFGGTENPPPAPTLPILPTSNPPVVIESPTSPPPPVVIESTSTPVTQAPQVDDQIMADVLEYYGEGYLPYPNGELTSLPDFSVTQPSMNIHELKRTGAQSQDFALWADIELKSIGSGVYPNYTGCGFAYRVQDGNAGYTAILTNEYVRMGACSSNMLDCELFGTLFFGTGEADVPNGVKTRFSLAVNHDEANVFVDGTRVGQYALYTSRLLGIGDLYFDVVSNYPAGYWTSCSITNVRLWESKP